MNTFGRLFRISLFGESHGKTVSVLIDGCPPGLPLNTALCKHDILRRCSGAEGTTSRKERDEPEFISGIHNGHSTGGPICISFKNDDANSRDYDEFKETPRPGRADLPAFKKYKGFNDNRGGGFFSGRMTLPLVAAGVVAKHVISPMDVKANLIEAGGSVDIDDAVKNAITEKDSIGGIIKCRISNVPAGLGEPFFDSIESCISHIMFSIPGLKGIEFGDFENVNFSFARMKGSEYNDRIMNVTGETATNHSGGIYGGISSGADIVFSIGLRPAASIPKPQQTINIKTGKLVELSIKGRHDSCYASRSAVIIEAAAAIALADLLLISKAC